MTRRFLICTGLGAIAFSVLLLVAFWGGYTASLSPEMEPYVRAPSRVAFLLCAPAMTFSQLFWPPVDHHYHLANVLVACGLTGTAFSLAIAGAVRMLRRHRRELIDVDRSAMSRREFLGASAAGGMVFASGGLGTYTTMIEPQQLCVREYELPIRDLPAAFDGLKILQFSDSHYGPFISSRYLGAAIRQANALAPDLVLLTGDYTHKYPETIDRGIGMLEELKSRYGSVAVLGNHEHWEGTEACQKRFLETGIPLVDNGRRFLTPDGIVKEAGAGDAICLAGLGDLWEDEVSYARALREVPEDMPRLVLSHNPDTAMDEHAGRFRVDAMFSGHTHGGQVSFPLVGPPKLPSDYGRRFAGGLCEGTGFPVVVSRGVGMAFLPVRFRVPPELVLVRLAQA